MKNIELRTLRQSMSEVLLQWADEYFDPTGPNFGQRKSRNKELWPAFLEFAGGMQGHGVSRSNFKEKIKDYCKYKGYDFNRDRPVEKPNGGKVFSPTGNLRIQTNHTSEATTNQTATNTSPSPPRK